MVTSKVKTHGHCGIDLVCELTSTHIDLCELTCTQIDIDDEAQMRYSKHHTDTYDEESEGEVVTYGIRVTDSEGNVVVHFADISTRKDFVERVITKLDCGASIVHITDILEDCMV